MPPKASTADHDQADAGEDPPGGGRRAMRFQYATGDKPLAGYTIKRGVGRGGFGEVYFATSDAGKEVALKLIRRNLDIEMRGVRQCLNLKHPNLVALYDLRSDDADDQWVVMEYVAGESLEDAINRQPDGMPLEDAISWLRGIAAGVGHLHSSGIVHRDLKPGNIYLERGSGPIEGRVKIGDYGLSKFISSSKRSGQTESVGTVHYMAPEIAGGRYGREIDSYALGVIFYEMLTGHVPFEGESVGEVLMKHLTAEPELSRVSEPYRSIVAGALAKDPDLRLASVEEMIALLPSDQPVDAAPAAPAEPTLPERQPIEPTVGQVWQPVSRPPHTDHPVPPREPLWQGLVELTDKMRNNWREWNVPPLGKGLALFGIVAGALASIGVWGSVVVMLLPLYFVYYVIWSAFSPAAVPPPATPTAEPAHTKPPKPHVKPRSTYNWRAAALRERSARPTRQKAASLTGSMLVSALVAAPIAMLAAIPLTADAVVDPTAFGLWLAVMAIAGSWGVLATSALSEAHLEDKLPRRGLNVLLGVGLGVLGVWLASTLGVWIPYGRDFDPGPREYLLEEMFDADFYRDWSHGPHAGFVPMTASMVYFGLLFGLVRWWRSADFVRRKRIGFWSLAGVAVVAYLVTLVSWYPQPIGMVLAALIAVATQAASPWCPPSRREALARGTEGGIYD